MGVALPQELGHFAVPPDDLSVVGEVHVADAGDLVVQVPDHVVESSPTCDEIAQVLALQLCRLRVGEHLWLGQAWPAAVSAPDILHPVLRAAEYRVGREKAQENGDPLLARIANNVIIVLRASQVVLAGYRRQNGHSPVPTVETVGVPGVPQIPAPVENADTGGRAPVPAETVQGGLERLDRRPLYPTGRVAPAAVAGKERGSAVRMDEVARVARISLQRTVAACFDANESPRRVCRPPSILDLRAEAPFALLVGREANAPGDTPVVEAGHGARSAGG